MSSNSDSSLSQATGANLILPPTTTTPSETSLTSPAWANGGDEAVVWFLEYRKAVKSAVYSYCASIQRARDLLERVDAAHYHDFHALGEHLSSIWALWRQFAAESTVITVDSLKNSVVSYDFARALTMMKSPRKCSVFHKKEMHRIRQNARDITSRLSFLRGLVDEIELRLDEMQTQSDATLADSAISLSIDLPAIPERLMEEKKEEKEDEEENANLPKLLSEVDMLAFEPIWVRSEPMPERLSEEVKELVALRPKSQMVGSKRTIFHMYGYDDVVSLMDDPACPLDDELVSIPLACDAGGFLLRNELDAATIPWCVARRYLDVPERTVNPVSASVVGIPPAVTNEAMPHRIDHLYPNARPQSFPQTVHTLRLKWNKDPAKLAAAADKALGGNFLGQPGLSFRGLSLRALAFSMSAFLPVIYTGTFDNEFGPGIYTTDAFNTACEHAGSTGAVMVFRNVDQRGLNIWEPELHQWNRFVSYFLDIKLNDVGVPSEYKTADIIHGPVSQDQGEARRKKRCPNPGDSNQNAFISYESCQRLMASLTAIIYLTR